MKIKFLVTALVVGGILLMGAAFGLSSLSVQSEKVTTQVEEQGRWGFP